MMALMKADALRCRGDITLFEKLKHDRHVNRTLSRLAEQEEESPMGVRRQLLSTALRLSETMAPSVHRIIADCRERLGVEIPLEVYVYSSPQFNAACVKPEQGRLFIMLSSALIESFLDKELHFVIGHELGHYVFAHHDIPIGYIIKGNERPAPDLTLQLFSWSRYAEISADRAGAYCAGDNDAVATALFRLASGLRTDLVTVKLEQFAAQMDEFELEGSADPANRTRSTDWFATHPFSPLRVKALDYFSQSNIVRADGNSIDDLEARVATLMALMEPSYLDEKTEVAEIMRRTLFAGAIAVADADHRITEAEIAVFEKFFGRRSFSDKLDVAAISDDLDHRIAEMNAHVPPARRIQVIRDLCLVVRADNMIEPKGRQRLNDLAKQLQVPTAIIDQTLTEEVEPD